MTTLPKKYRPADHEPQIHAKWESAGVFHADPASVNEKDQKPYCIIIPPPNVTARLHLGHALNNTLQDVLIRTHRMMGCQTLWMPGTDHAGIATQTVVEKRVLETEGKRRTDFSREEFTAKIQAFKDEYEQTITDQLKAMGCACDWDRQRFTMDDTCARAVREAFFRLFKDGLIYRGKRLVNWDPVTQTALADDEVENQDVNGNFYYLRYPLIHPADAGDHNPVTWGELSARGYPGADQYTDDEQAWVTVATTRPETYLGDTAIAINPSDPRAGSLRGLLIELPIVGRKIPIVEDDYVVRPDPKSDDPKAQFTTGFLKVTPAHDPNDWDLGLRHNLPAINIMAPDASISDQHGWEDVGDAHIFVGKSREEARKLVIKEFQARAIAGDSLLEEIKPYRHSVGHSYRSHAAIEPYLSDQWYVKVTDDHLRGAALRSMAPDQRTTDSFKPDPKNPHDGQLHFHPDRYAKTFETWHDNLRDWCVSRQLWWGHQIPVWSAKAGWWVGRQESQDPYEEWLLDKMDEGEVVSRQRDAEEDRTSYRRGDDLSNLFLCFRSELSEDDKQILENAGFEQDPDVLDTWFSSALWPMSTMGWPESNEQTKGLLEAFNPSSVLCTAREIITLWVSRMVMFNRYFLGQDDNLGAGNGRLPFNDVFIHAMIQDGQGRKMSKSLGNGVDPLDIIESHGTDAMRFTLCQMTTQTQDVRMPVEKDEATGKNTSAKFDAGRNFCNKLFNATRFALSNLENTTADVDIIPADLPLPDRWMLARLARAINTINESIEQYQFANYADTIYDLLWRDFCDWYLESIKNTVRTNPAQQAVLKAVLESILRLLQPIAPFITQTLFEQLNTIKTAPVPGLTLTAPTNNNLLCTARWPEIDSSWLDEKSQQEYESIQRLVQTIREVRAQHKVAPKRRITLHIDADLSTKITKLNGIIQTLAGLDTIAPPQTPAPDDAIAFRFDQSDLHLSNLADAVDVDTERARLEKQIAELNKSKRTLEGRLGNPGYTDKAPPAMVEQTRNQLDQVRAELAASTQALERLE